MKIAKDKVVVLTYELTVEGKLADKATKEQPLDYIHGTHMLIPKFESEIEGKEPGDTFEFTVSPEEGYGTYEPKHCFDIPKDSFEIDGKIREDLLIVGNFIPMLNSSGHVVNGKIVAVKEDAVTMDFNHPMAGKVLNFKGEIVEVRDATEKELREGLHGEYLPQEECGCGCGHHHHHHDGECGCHHDHHEDGGCCHHDHHEDGECCHHDHHKDGECCHHDHHKDGECCCHHNEN